MKTHIRSSAKRELHFQKVTYYDEPGIRESRALEIMSNAVMETEDYRSRVISLE